MVIAIFLVINKYRYKLYKITNRSNATSYKRWNSKSNRDNEQTHLYFMKFSTGESGNKK
jgi:hypothetical protein